MSVAGDIQQVAFGLYDLSQQPRDVWLATAHRIEEIRLSGGVIERLPAAVMLASGAKAIARQMPYAHASNETELRGVALALSTILLNELSGAGVEIAAPWWNKA